MSLKKFKTMDGNEAAAYISYAFTEVATIYPITPSSPMADHVDEWAAAGMKNIFGQPVKLMELQAESGACGAMHGALETGSLATTYTASQGLLLMIPPMYRIAGSMLPGVMHVSARTVSTHGLSIFGDHSDVMGCRQTGFAQLASSSVQECMDLGAVAHLSAIKGSIPFQHFFEGFRTSHEIQKIEVLDYDDMSRLVDWDAVRRFKARALNSEHPTVRNTVQNPDTFFQHREACNGAYDRLPAIVEEYMKAISDLTGRDYQLFNYYGAPDADRVVIAMGSVCGTLGEVIDYLNAQGQKVGMIQVHLYRPFSVSHFLSKLPETVKTISVLDRTKEPGAIGEPLYEDVCTALAEAGRGGIKVLAGRYGLSSKDTTPAQMKAVYDNMAGEQKNHFTVGIVDDVTHRSLDVGENISTAGGSTIECKFWGLGSDGTVGANKNSIKIIGDNTPQYVQAYFEYDSKKSGGVTKSHLRFGKEPIRSAYYVTQADFVACHKQSYIHSYDIVHEVKPGGTFLLNTLWKGEELERNLPNHVKRTLARNHVKFYTIDAVSIAQELGLGNRTNTVLQAAFFKLSGVLPVDEAVQYMKDAITHSYFKKGDKVLNMNYAAVDRGLQSVEEIPVPDSWKDLPDEPLEQTETARCAGLRPGRADPRQRPGRRQDPRQQVPAPGGRRDGGGDLQVRKAGHRRGCAPVAAGQLHRLQPVLPGVPPRRHPALPVHPGGGGAGPGRLRHPQGQRQGHGELHLPHPGGSPGLPGLRQLRRRVPRQGEGPGDEAPGVPDAGAGQLGSLPVPVREGQPPGQVHRPGQPVPAAADGVLRRLRRLRRDPLHEADDPAVRRADVHRQRHRLRPGHVPVRALHPHGEGLRRPRPGPVQLPV